MKCIYFVTEGQTDRIVLEGLVEHWLEEDFISRHIQPPSSAFVEDMDTVLSEGWKGVLAWCDGKRPHGLAGRNEAFQLADCIIVHTDADVATEADFKTPVFSGNCPPARNVTDWVRNHLAQLLGPQQKTVLCVPAQDLEAWITCALHPDVADQHMPIECKQNPASLLIQRNPYRLVRSKDGRFRKVTTNYSNALSKIIQGWADCTTRCPEALRFEQEVKSIL